MRMKWWMVVVALSGVGADYPDDLQACPEDCDCHYFRVNYVTDCSESNFTEIPYDEISPNVYILDMNGNQISDVEGSRFPEDVKIRRLQLAENELTKVTAVMFNGLKYMLDIDLSSNRITTIDSDAFKDSVGLITIELQNNPLKRINTGPLISNPTVIYLDISNCGLSHLNDEFFSQVPFLTTLYLSGNPLTDISLRLLSSLKIIEELKLSQCNLTHLNPEFLNDLVHLKLLDLSQNNFQQVDWGAIFSGIPRLETLNLERNGLRGLPNDVFSNNTWIRNLDLSDNDFGDTDIGLLGDNLKNLHQLDLSNCNIHSLDENSFSNASKLKSLDLGHNNLLPREVLRALVPIKKLTHLSLRNCSLHKLPKSIFENLSELRELDVSWNPLNNLFEELLQPLQQLEFLNMGYSNLKNLNKNTFSQTNNLKKLVLSGNPLGELEPGLFKELTKLEILEMNQCGLGFPLDQDVFFNETYTELQELRIAGNPLKIRDIPLIPEQLSKIKILDLSNCSIRSLPESAFTHVRNITHLYLNMNMLTDASATKSKFLNGLHHLEYLDLSSNNFTQLSVDFVADTDLKKIKLTNNPWICDCSIAKWWSWARRRGDLAHLVGASLTLEDISKGGNKRKKALLCTLDPVKSPLLPRNATRRTRIEAATKTWARYLKESPCKVDNLVVTTTLAPVLFPEPILPSPGPAMLTHVMDQMEKEEGDGKSELSGVMPLPLVGALSAVVIAFLAVLAVYLRRRRLNVGGMDFELAQRGAAAVDSK